VVGRALEHEVLEEVRQAGLAWRFVGRSHPVPKHVRDHRRSMVGDQDDLHAIRELEHVGVEQPC
jgi:hypothetical protein